MARFHAAVAAHVQIPALLRGDDADVLGLRLRAFARAAGHPHLHLVRRADAAVAVLDVDRHRDRVLHTVAAPGAADARFHGAQRLAVGMPGLEAGVDQVLPDERQLLDARAKEVDALRAGDLGVQAVLLRDLAEHDQLLRGDLAARHARHDGVGAVLLQIGEEVVVRILQRRVLGLEDHLVPARGEDRGDCRLAGVAAPALAVLDDDRVEGPQVPDPCQMKKLLPRVIEMLAKVVLHFEAALFQLGIQDLLRQRSAASATRRCLGFLLQGTETGASRADRFDDPSLRHPVARAHERGIGQHFHADAFPCALVRGKNQLLGMLRQWQRIERHLQKGPVFGRIAHENRPEQVLAVARDNQLLVCARGFVDEDIVEGVRRRAMCITNGGNVDTHELELSAHIGAEELRTLLARHLPRGDLRHLVAGRDQAVDAAVPQRALAESVDVRIAGLAMIVHHDAAALADRKPGRPRELVARANARGEHGDVRFQHGAVGEQQLVAASGTCTETPSASILRRSSRPPESSSCTAINRGANSTTCVSRPRSWSALAASRPSNPPPMTVPTRAWPAAARIASRSSIAR